MSEAVQSSTNTEDKEYEIETEHDIRLSKLTLSDPIHSVDFCWYFQQQVPTSYVQFVFRVNRILNYFIWFAARKTTKPSRRRDFPTTNGYSYRRDN